MVKGDGVHADDPGIQAVVSAYAGTGIAIWFPAGRYLITAPIVIPNGESTLLRGYSATLVSNMAPVGGQVACILRAKPIQPAAPNADRSTRRRRSATPRSPSTCRPRRSWATGSTRQPGRRRPHGAAVQGGRAQAVGAAPFTIAVDRPVLYAFAAGAGSTATEFASIPQDIKIEGITFAGTGDRAVQILGGWRCTMTDCHYSPSDGLMSDAASRST